MHLIHFRLLILAIEIADRSFKKKKEITSIDSLVLARVRSPGSLVVDAAL